MALFRKYVFFGSVISWHSGLSIGDSRLSIDPLHVLCLWTALSAVHPGVITSAAHYGRDVIEGSDGIGNLEL
jgi:hypothetical protein